MSFDYVRRADAGEVGVSKFDAICTFVAGLIVALLLFLRVWLRFVPDIESMVAMFSHSPLPRWVLVLAGIALVTLFSCLVMLSRRRPAKPNLK